MWCEYVFECILFSHIQEGVDREIYSMWSFVVIILAITIRPRKDGLCSLLGDSYGSVPIVSSLIVCVFSTLINLSRAGPSKEPARCGSQVSDGWTSPSYQSCVGFWNEAKRKIARTHRRFYPDFNQIDYKTYWEKSCTKPVVLVSQKYAWRICWLQLSLGSWCLVI